jgi:hypothetical protein
MATLASFSLPEAIRESENVLHALRILLLHIDKCETPQEPRVFRHIIDYTIGQFERVPDLASKLDIDLCLASTTFPGQRQLFLPTTTITNLLTDRLFLYTDPDRSRG